MIKGQHPIGFRLNITSNWINIVSSLNLKNGVSQVLFLINWIIGWLNNVAIYKIKRKKKRIKIKKANLQLLGFKVQQIDVGFQIFLILDYQNYSFLRFRHSSRGFRFFYQWRQMLRVLNAFNKIRVWLKLVEKIISKNFNSIRINIIPVILENHFYLRHLFGSRLFLIKKPIKRVLRRFQIGNKNLFIERLIRAVCFKNATLLLWLFRWVVLVTKDRNLHKQLAMVVRAINLLNSNNKWFKYLKIEVRGKFGRLRKKGIRTFILPDLKGSSAQLQTLSQKVYYDQGFITTRYGSYGIKILFI